MTDIFTFSRFFGFQGDELIWRPQASEVGFAGVREPKGFVKHLSLMTKCLGN